MSSERSCQHAELMRLLNQSEQACSPQEERVSFPPQAAAGGEDVPPWAAGDDNVVALLRTSRMKEQSRMTRRKQEMILSLQSLFTTQPGIKIT